LKHVSRKTGNEKRKAGILGNATSK